MAIETKAVGKEWTPATFEVEARGSASTRTAVGEESPIYHDPEAAKAAGFRDWSRRRCSAVVYSAPAMGPAILDPEVGINLPGMVHGGQEFEWGEPVCAGDVITTTATLRRRSTSRTARGSTCSSPYPPTRTARRRCAQLDRHRRGV